VEVVGTAHESSQTVSTLNGPSVIRSWGAQLIGDRALTVNVAELGKVAGKTADQILDGSVAGAVEAVEGTLETSRNLEVAGCPAREFTASAADYHLKARVLILGRRTLVQLISVAPRDTPLSEATDRFLGSFRRLTAAGEPKRDPAR